MRNASTARCLAVVTLALTAPAVAQDAADAARRALIDDAAAAAQAGDHARAIELGTRAAALRATPSLRYFLAREHLAAGHAVEALAHAGECAAGARADREVHHREALVARCEAVAAEAERGVARLTVQVPTPPPEGLRVTVAGGALAPALYAVPVPVAPGAVEVTAEAVGREPFRTTVTLTAGERETLSVTLAAPPPPPPPSAPPPAPTPQPPRGVARSLGAAPWVVLGVGAVGMAVGGALGAVALDARGDRDAACPAPTRCDVAEATRFDARYRDAALGANVALVVGGATVVAAVAWWVVARVTARRADRVALSPAGLTLRW